MSLSQCSLGVAAIVTAIGLALPGGASASQEPRPAVERQVARETAPALVTQQVVVAQDQDARETREKLEELLKKTPPGVGRVLRTDPSLLTNESYLATYPALAVFIKQHPEIRSNPGFFFEHVGSYEFWNPSPPESRERQALRMWSEVLGGFAFLCVFLTITSVLIWIVRNLIEWRRWTRVSKIQTEVHNKLMDRFANNEDLLSYIQTPAGRRFLEAAPLPLEAPARPLSAPFTRILWSVQAGVVLGAAALGLLFISRRVVEDVAGPLFAIGVLALAVGAGFVVSAAASFLLSRRFGLLEPVGAPREHSEAPGRSA